MFNPQALVEVMGSILLFMLVFGMSATVDIDALRNQIHHYKAIICGLLLQFVAMPFLGFLVVKTLNMDYVTGVILLVITSSPGGSYSNWFCSLFNGDLALSVAMTAITTLCSVVMLPLNLYVYAHLAFHHKVSELMTWHAVLPTLFLVVVAISSGLLASQRYGTTEFHLWTNRMGNVAGILLVCFSLIVSTVNGSRIWNQTPLFYFGVALPCLLGLLVASIVTTLINLIKPHRVTVSVECCIQNTGIAVSVALTLFAGETLGMATAVPLYYGIVECIVVSLYCTVAWKKGWTKAPVDVPLWTMLTTSYEVIQQSEDQDDKADGFVYVQEGDKATAGTTV